VTEMRNGAAAATESVYVVPRDVSPEAITRSLQLLLPTRHHAIARHRFTVLDTFDEPRGNRRHNALDIPAPRGTPVISATAGKVLRVFSSQAGGLMVYASDPADRFVLMYAHLDRYANGLADGMPLQRGDTIGFVGTTGNAPPNVPHLHFAIARTSNVGRWWTGMPVDPRPLLRR